MWKVVMSKVWCETSNYLRSLSTEAAGELDVFALDGDLKCQLVIEWGVLVKTYTLGMDRAC
jgi:hypothetical protein